MHAREVRLTLLGLVEDYVVTYTPSPEFDVEFTAPELPDRPGAVRPPGELPAFSPHSKLTRSF